PEMRIFSISFGVLIMMAIVLILAVGRTEPLEGGFDRCGDLLDGLVAIDFFEASLLSVVLDDRRGLGFKGLHSLDEYRLGVVGALDQDCAVLITDAGDRRGIGIGIVDAAGGRDAAAGDAAEKMVIIDNDTDGDDGKSSRVGSQMRVEPTGLIEGAG